MQMAGKGDVERLSQKSEIQHILVSSVERPTEAKLLQAGDSHGHISEAFSCLNSGVPPPFW